MNATPPPDTRFLLGTFQRKPNKPGPSSPVYPSYYVQEAQLLLAYVSRNGLEVDEKIVAEIVQAKWLAPHEWTAEHEINFWHAFNILTKKVYPVSVASLKATYPVQEGQSVETSVARRTVSFYQKWSVLILLLLLFMQIYWLMGSVRYASFAELPKKLESLENQLEIEKQRIPKEKWVESREINAIESDIERYNYLIISSIERLYAWNPTWLLDFSGEYQGDNKPGWGKLEMPIKDVQFVLEVMQLYLLPLLYGLLGASAYVLRSLNIEIRELTYIEESNISYRLRIQLGALSGLAVGWFSVPDHPFSFGSLSPLALAFLAGYSVEILFAGMDVLIARLSTNSSDSPRKKSKFSEHETEKSLLCHQDASKSKVP